MNIITYLGNFTIKHLSNFYSESCQVKFCSSRISNNQKTGLRLDFILFSRPQNFSSALSSLSNNFVFGLPNMYASLLRIMYKHIDLNWVTTDVKSRVTTIFLNLLRQLLFQEWNFESYVRYYSSIWCLFKSNLAWIGLVLSLIWVGFKLDRFIFKPHIRLTYIFIQVFLI